MKKYLTLLLGFSGPFLVFSQELSFSIVGTEAAYCRTSAEQSGNGIVYAAATGGTPDYTYEWTALATGETSTNTTWGGRNAGDYRIRVIDADGTELIDTVRLDSVNPIADFTVTSDDVTPSGPGYVGSAPATVTFTNNSMHFVSPIEPVDVDTVFLFKPIGPLELEEYEGYPELTDYTYEFGGAHTATLIVYNINSCVDTVRKTFYLTGPLSIENEGLANAISIASHTIDNSISIQNNTFSTPFDFRLYDLSGKLILQEEIQSETTIIPLYGQKGTFVYELSQSGNGDPMMTGKLLFP